MSSSKPGGTFCGGMRCTNHRFPHLVSWEILWLRAGFMMPRVSCPHARLHRGGSPFFRRTRQNESALYERSSRSKTKILRSRRRRSARTTRTTRSTTKRMGVRQFAEVPWRRRSVAGSVHASDRPTVARGVVPDEVVCSNLRATRVRTKFDGAITGTCQCIIVEQVIHAAA